MSTDHDDLRRLLGGYLLGGLDDPDTDRLDAHLLTCDECRAEVERLAPVPELLRSLDQALPVTVAAGSRPSPARIEGLLTRMRAQQSRERRHTTARRLVAVAAAALLVAAGVGVILTRENESTLVRPPIAAPSTQPAVTAFFQAADGSGMAGQAVLTGKTWGVSVDLTMSKLPGQGPFVCKVSKSDGTEEQAAIWGPTPSGNARVTGASSIQLRNVSRVAVADHDGHVLGTADLN